MLDASSALRPHDRRNTACNIGRNISASTTPHGRSASARSSLYIRDSCAIYCAISIARIAPPGARFLRLVCAALVAYIAPEPRTLLRLYVVGMARGGRCSCATMPQSVRNACASSCALPAHAMRVTRAVIVAIGCECGAILAPMHPPMLHQTRAIAASSMRRLGAVSDSTSAAAGGAS